MALVNVGVFLALLGCLEIGARVFFPRDFRAVFNDPDMFVRGRPFVTSDAERGFALKPGYEGSGCRVNAAGFRGPELPRDLGDRKRVLALGESSTFGWMVDDDETWPAQVQRLLGADESLVVINGGVPSYTSAQVLIYLRQLLPRLDPDVVIVMVLWNDVLYSCIDNWFPELLVIQQPARWRQILLRHSGLYRALLLRKDRDGPAEDVKNPEALAYFRDNLTRIARECEEQGIELVLVHPAVHASRIPESGMKIGPRTVSQEFFIELLDDFARVLDEVAAEYAVPLVRHRLSIGNAVQDSFFLDPAHPSRSGHKLVAEEIASTLSH
ncbi:MAG: SGNH/GDSL hydrolase family protein [Candidatus Krumholzibacteriia bacterium]